MELDLGNEARDIKVLVTDTLILIILLMEPLDSINAVLRRRDVSGCTPHHGQGLSGTDLSASHSCLGRSSHSGAKEAELCEFYTNWNIASD